MKRLLYTLWLTPRQRLLYRVANTIVIPGRYQFESRIPQSKTDTGCVLGWVVYYGRAHDFDDVEALLGITGEEFYHRLTQIDPVWHFEPGEYVANTLRKMIADK